MAQSLRDLKVKKSNLSFQGIDYVEFYVGNAFQSAYFYQTAFGFMPIAYAGLETGLREQVSLVLEQGHIRLLLTSAVTPDSLIAEHVALHGDGVKDIAFRVDDAVQTFEEMVKRGAQPILEPTVYQDKNGKVIKATISTFGDTWHSFIQRNAYEGIFFPNYHKPHNLSPTVSIGIAEIDHIAICVEAGELESYSKFYSDLMDFHESYRMDISGVFNGMNSRVLEDKTGNIKFTICEPASSQFKSQIDEYIKFNGGSGVQHIAFLTNNIVKTVQALLNNGMRFLNQPDTYYEMLEGRIGEIDEDIAVLRNLNVLADRDQDGYLLQAFTQLVQDRPTFFLEVIQRNGTRSFGQGNVKALFEAVQREQSNRGNLE